MNPRIAYIQNASPYSGVGQRATHILRRLQSMNELVLDNYLLDGEQRKIVQNGNVLTEISPLMKPFNVKSINWIRLASGLRSHVSNAKVFHATNQTLSFLADKFEPTIVTVHDLIETLEPQDIRASVINRYLYKGIKNAAHIIAVSEYTAQTIQDHYGISKDSITVIPNGVDDTFHPILGIDKATAFKKHNVETEGPVVLYVGSDHPRKNLPAALTAFAIMKQSYPTATFVKVGAPGLASGRQQTLEAIDELNIKGTVQFIDTVSDTDLNELFNAADVLLFPSKFEGFGLPPLQAMAAGLPVVCSNATSLPEVVGDAAQTHDSDDVDGMAASMVKLFDDDGTRSMYIQKGLQRAAMFSWDRAAEQELEVYKKFI